MTAATVAQRPIRTGATRRRPIYLRRRIAALLTILVVIGAITGLWAMRSNAAAQPDALEATVVVGDGETVWDVAAAFTPQGEHPQVYVAEVLRYNDVDAAAVQPGTVLRLPRD